VCLYLCAGYIADSAQIYLFIHFAQYKRIWSKKMVEVVASRFGDRLMFA